MTVSNTTNKYQYTGNGVTTSFAFSNIFFATTDLLVTLYNTSTLADVTPAPVLNGAATYDYTITATLNADTGEYPSGTIVFTTAPPSTYRVTIERVVPQTQSVTLIDNSKFPANTVNGALDRLTILSQRNAQLIAQALYYPSSDPTTVTNILPDAGSRASMYLAFDASGNPIASPGTPGSTPISAFWATTVQIATAAASLTALGGVASSILTTTGDLFLRGASAIGRLAIGSTGQVLTVVAGTAAWTTPATATFAGARQTVAAGPVSTAGLPTFLPSTNAALSITSQNVSSSAPLVASAAGGWSASTGMPVDTVGYSSANLTWSGLTLNRAAATPNYLYGTISGGVITPASTIVAPVYQWGGTPAVTSGLITFNVGEMKAYLGNGATAPATNLVVFGEAATDATTVISTVAYAYNGEYESAFTATLPAAGTVTTANHNIGVYPRFRDFVIECTTINLTYAVGDQISNLYGLESGDSLYTTMPMIATRNSIRTGVVNGGNYQALYADLTTRGVLTVGSWKYKIIASRGW